MPLIGRASTQLQSAKFIEGPTFSKGAWLKHEYAYFVKVPFWGPEIVLAIYIWLVLLFGVIMCHFSFYSMVNTTNQLQIHRFESRWLRHTKKKKYDEGFIFSGHARNQAKDNFSRSTKNTFVDSKSNCIYWCLTLLAYQKDK